MKKVSIVTTFYNSGNFVHTAIRCLLNQTYSNIEFVCVNDGSSDDTLIKLEDYQKKDARIKIVDKENQGAAHFAKEAGVNAATGEFIFLFDHDDALTSDVIENAMIAFEENPNLDGVCPVVTYKASEGNIIKKQHLDEQVSEEEFIEKIINGKDAFEKTIGFFRISILGLYRSEIVKKSFQKNVPNTFNADEIIWRKILLNCNCIGTCKGEYIYYQYENSTAKKEHPKQIGFLKTDMVVKEMAIENNLFNKNQAFFEVYLFRNLMKSTKIYIKYKSKLSSLEKQKYFSWLLEAFESIDKKILADYSKNRLEKLFRQLILSNFNICFAYNYLRTIK